MQPPAIVQENFVTHQFPLFHIYAPGSPVLRPLKTVAGTVIVSVLLGLQVTGLIILAWYIYTVPTWTAAFDSIAVAQLIKSVDDDHIPPIGYADDEKLKDVDGLVGIAEKDVTSSAFETSETAEDSHHWNVEQSTTNADSNPGGAHLQTDGVQDEEVAIGISSATVLGRMIKLARGGPGLITKAYAPTPAKRSWWHRRRTHEPLPQDIEARQSKMKFLYQVFNAYSVYLSTQTCSKRGKRPYRLW